MDVTEENGMIVFQGRYNATFHSLVKALPSTQRKYNGWNKTWSVVPSAAKDLIDTARLNGVSFSIDSNVKFTDDIQQGVFSFDLDYIGVPKRRATGHYTAIGLVNGEWNVVFPANVLLEFFGGQIGITHYSVLGINENASPELVKRAYRRAARTYHPDINDDLDAAAQFIKVKQAYEVLSDPDLRARYDLGLYMQSKIDNRFDKNANIIDSWRPPVRCGKLTVRGTKGALGIEVEEILAWDDIVVDGMTMVSRWDWKLQQVIKEWA